MRSPTVIYGVLVLWVIIGVVADSFLLKVTSDLTLNDLVQAIGIALLVLLWCRADAETRQQKFPQSTIGGLAVALLPPVGHALYLAASRPAARAAAIFLGFWLGLVVAMAMGSLAAGQLADLIWPPS